MSISLEARIFFFAYDFLWSVHSLYHYLDEKIATEDIGSLYLKWSTPHGNLAGWLGEERLFSIHNEQASDDEKDELFSLAGTFGDSLIFHWGSAIKDTATDMNQKYPAISESIWAYYCYCGFLRQALTEFDQILQGLSTSLIYYERYRQHVSLFNDIARALENERPFLDTIDVSEIVRQSTWDDIDIYASKLGTEWRQAVHSAARDLTLPEFDRNS